MSTPEDPGTVRARPSGFQRVVGVLIALTGLLLLVLAVQDGEVIRIVLGGLQVVVGVVAATVALPDRRRTPR